MAFSNPQALHLRYIMEQRAGFYQGGVQFLHLKDQRPAKVKGHATDDPTVLNDVLRHFMLLQKGETFIPRRNHPALLRLI
jgi:hypothetical protein